MWVVNFVLMEDLECEASHTLNNSEITYEYPFWNPQGMKQLYRGEAMFILCSDEVLYSQKILVYYKKC